METPSQVLHSGILSSGFWKVLPGAVEKNHHLWKNTQAKLMLKAFSRCTNILHNKGRSFLNWFKACSLSHILYSFITVETLCCMQKDPKPIFYALIRVILKVRKKHPFLWNYQIFLKQKDISVTCSSSCAFLVHSAARQEWRMHPC